MWFSGNPDQRCAKCQDEDKFEGVIHELDPNIDFDEVFKRVEEHAKESFGKPDVVLPDAQRAWDALKDKDKK